MLAGLKGQTLRQAVRLLLLRKRREQHFANQVGDRRHHPVGIEIVPNPAKAHERQPDFRIFSGANELGAGWVKTSRETGKAYISLRIFHPQIAQWPIYANLGRAAGQDDDDVLAVIVNEAA